MSRRQSFVVILIGLIAAAIAAATICVRKQSARATEATVPTGSIKARNALSEHFTQSAAPSAIKAHAAPDSWAALSESQHTALAPLEHDWETFNVARKRKWLTIAARYSHLSVPQQERLHQRMTEWVNMTPKERDIARANFEHYNALLSPQRRNNAWNAYQHLSAAQKKKLAAQAEHSHASASSALANQGKNQNPSANSESSTTGSTIGLSPDERSQH